MDYDPIFRTMRRPTILNISGQLPNLKDDVIKELIFVDVKVSMLQFQDGDNVRNALSFVSIPPHLCRL